MVLAVMQKKLDSIDRSGRGTGRGRSNMKYREVC
jgi:hypothetical protein